MKKIGIGLFIMILAVTGWADDGRGDGRAISVADGWARASSGPNSAIFMHIYNDDDGDDVLISAVSAAAKTTELHTHVKDGDVYKMRPVNAMPVKAGGKTTLKPGGLHIMLLGITNPIQEGDWVPVTLTFQSGRVIDLKVRAKKKQCMCHESRQKKVQN